MTKRLPLLLLVTFAPLPGCGHRGDPLPPLRRTPPALGEFRLAQRGDSLELQASSPTASVDGVAYETASVEFLHATGSAELEQGGARQTVRVAPGARAVLPLPLPPPGTVVRAAARGTSGGQAGPRTLTAVLVAQAPLERPLELTASLGETGVELAWKGVRPKEVPPPEGPVKPGKAKAAAAAAAPSPVEPKADARPEGKADAKADAKPAPKRRNGFFVYRRGQSESFDDALVKEPLEFRNFRDESAPLGTTSCYVVRAVASTDPLIESAPSNEVCLVRRDVTPPAPPTGLTILSRPEGLELIWSPSSEEDLAGYRVYRATADGPPERLSELPAGKASYLDTAARPGTAYRYTLTAFDQAGNESAPGDPVAATRP